MKILPIRLYNNYHSVQKANTNNIISNYRKTENNEHHEYNGVTFGQLYVNPQSEEIKKAINSLADNSKSAESLGLYGPHSKAKTNLIKNFIQSLKKLDVSIVAVSITDKSANSISQDLHSIINDSRVKFEQTHKKTAIFIQNIDMLNEKNDYQYSDAISQIQKLEHSKQQGIIWIWSAKDKDNVDSSLLRRTNDLILVQPSKEDSKQTWFDYLALIDKMPKTSKRTALMSEAIKTMPKVFPIKVSNSVKTGIESVKDRIHDNVADAETEERLSIYQNQLSLCIESAKIAENLSVLKNTVLSPVSLVDFWLDLSGEDSTKYTSRLKNEWLDSVLKDPNKTSSLISQTLDKLQEENALIEAARTAYRDIIENEDEITPEQKEILIQQQDSKLFFQVVSNNLKPDDSIKLQLNTIEILRQLSKEKEEVKANARENIFDPARELKLENEDSNDIVNYIFDLLSQKALAAPQQEKEELKALVESFEQAKDSGDTDEFNSIWQKLINIAQEYFETDELDNLTNTNIILLDSINKNMKDEKNQRIISLVNNPNLSVEQREFVSRYKDDKNFRLMINNPNVDSFSAIENLVYFEAGNKNLIQEAGFNYSDNDFKKIMSDKFHQIDKEAKDINIQGDRIVAKLGELNSSVSEFANGFSVYANCSLENQAKQLEQMYISNDLLSSIDKNTQEIKAYTQAQVRAKLVELEKDKYYKDIVPEITKLLPEDEQINLKDFLSKVDDLVKNEKDTKRKKAILTAAAVVAGTAIAAAAIYYVGPTVVAHLASKLPQGASAAQALTSTMGLVNKAKLLGNSKLISFLSRTVSQITTEIKAVERRIKQLQELIMKYPNDTSYAAELDRCHDRLGKLYAELGRATN